MNKDELTELGRLVAGLPNGCSLSHYSTGTESDDVAWQVFGADLRMLAEGPTPLAAMRQFAAQLRSEDGEL